MKKIDPHKARKDNYEFDDDDYPKVKDKYAKHGGTDGICHCPEPLVIGLVGVSNGNILRKSILCRKCGGLLEGIIDDQKMKGGKEK